MAHARPVQRGFPGTTTSLLYVAAAFVAGLAILAAVTLGELRLFGPAGDSPGTPSAAVLSSESMWMTERLAQSGYLDPATRSAREWERQRRQQSSGF